MNVLVHTVTLDDLDQVNLEELGEGLYGKVYKVQHERNIQFALKRMKYRDGFDMEKEVAAMTVLRHKNVVKFFNHWRTSIAGVEHLDILMEYCEGGTLSGWCENPRRYEHWCDRKFQLRIFRQIIVGVKYCHRNRVGHGDLHARNILMVNPDNPNDATPKICDFGCVNDIHKTSSMFKTTNHLLKTCGNEVWWAMFVNDLLDRKTVSTITAQEDDIQCMALIFITLRNALSGKTSEQSGMTSEDMKIYNAITEDRCTADELLVAVGRTPRKEASTEKHAQPTDLIIQ